jgi:hypothetical protein
MSLVLDNDDDYDNSKGKAVLTTHLWRRRGERMYSSYSFTTSALMGVSGQRHTPAALHPQEKDPRYPLDRGLRGPRN